MAARRERIATDLAEAKEALDNAKATQQAYETQLAGAKAEAQAIIDKAVKQAEINTQAQLKELKEQLEREKEQARQELAREREKAMQQMREDMVTLSVAIAGKIVAKNMDSQANQDLVKEAIAKLDSKAIG